MNFPDENAAQSLQLFEPTPDAVYPIEAVAHLVSTSRRTILIYCKHGLLTPVVDPADNGYYFNDEAIRMLRRIESLREICGNNLAAVRLILELSHEVERLSSEVRFLRQKGSRKMGDGDAGADWLSW
jgi:DNA-binding transcriptional MerR regulator